MSDSPQSEVAIPEDARVTELRGLYDPELDFRKLAAEAEYFARGFRLVEKDDLIGVPFVVINATFREGYLDPVTKEKGDYVSLECVVADKEILEAPQTQAQLNHARAGTGPLGVYPSEPVVINDGSTGIRRSMVEVLSLAGDVKTGGDYDRPYQVWEKGSAEAEFGFSRGQTRALPYVALRGLRRSDYENEFGEATTFYFA